MRRTTVSGFVLLTTATLIATATACARQPEPLIAGASGPAAAAAQAASLAGTRWRLVEIQSMDDAAATTRPADPRLYTLAFLENGRVAMRLNCNQGVGPWSVTPDSRGTAGSLAIGPLAVTRALCPPPSLDERIARDMDAVRGYTLRDGQLSLSLMADAGVYLWERDDTPAGGGQAPRTG